MKAPNESAGQGKVSTKVRILSAAQYVFAEKGFEGASTREIAARAGVNISSLHYHWDSKETLFLAILQNVQEQLVDRLKDVVDGHPPATPQEARRTIEAAMGATFDFFAEDLTVPRLLMRRIIDRGGSLGEREQVAVESGWPIFLDWVRVFTGGALKPEEAGFFLVTIQSILLVVMLDSPLVADVIGGSIEDPAARQKLRARVIQLVENLLGVEEKKDGAT